MEKRLFMLAAFLGALGVFLFWFSGVVENIEDSAVARGEAECEKEIVIQEKEVVKYVYKSDSKIYAKPNSDINGIVEWLRGNKKK